MSGVSLDRALALEKVLVSRMGDVFSCAILCRSTSEHISDGIQRVYASPEWKRAPRWVQSYCAGYLQARRDELYRVHLEWMLWFDGRLIRDRSFIPAGRWCEVDCDRSRHVWLGHAECPYDARWLDKPF